MKTSEINKEFEKILSALRKVEGLPLESIVQVAQVILQESGKDRRTELMRESHTNCNGDSSKNSNDVPATPRQKNALKNFGIKYRDDITKAEASELLDKAFAELESNRENSYQDEPAYYVME